MALTIIFRLVFASIIEFKHDPLFCRKSNFATDARFHTNSCKMHIMEKCRKSNFASVARFHTNSCKNAT